ncbi:hypothetical protein PMI07_004834 [Rhizobium sp. CF080]|uniref:hypothetical protein n=1 Tax=Rhizobium sp. (strain CF080) TaxID=1144310 RepID=UPI000271CCFD|nr:hypothetical protein [Rhizobium sp. CF080]EUB98553.1 hypothetical protein PMI07_004834 [Rhizobium sp. CF080]
MKSPWKFLAGLRSPRRPVETQASSVEDETDIEASESDVQQTPAPSSNSTEASSHPDQDGKPAVDLVATATSNENERDLDVSQPISPPVDGEEIQTPAHQEIDRPGADADASVPETRTSIKSPRTPRTKRPGRAKRTRTDLVSQSTVAADSDQSAQSPSARESFFDDVASLDEEIRQLRSQLAQKLHLQNAQLSKMLSRFDRS